MKIELPREKKGRKGDWRPKAPKSYSPASRKRWIRGVEDKQQPQSPIRELSRDEIAELENRLRRAAKAGVV